MAAWGWSAVVYAVYPVSLDCVGRTRRRGRAVAASAAYGIGAAAAATLDNVTAQVVLPGACTLGGYWLSGLFVGTPQQRLEQWLLESDRALFGQLSIDRLLAAAPRWALDVLEFSYSTVYLVVVAGAIAMALIGREAILYYWAVVLPAELICYAALPFLRSRPPRSLEPTGVIASRAPIMDWQLDAIIREEPYLAALTFPLNQFNGANVNLVEILTVNHAITSEPDALNYIARLRQVAARLDEATERAAEISEQGILPPRFIADATLTQMRSFIAAPAAQNPLVTAFVERVAAVSAIPAARREALTLEATGIVDREVYPAWRRGVTLLQGQLPRTTNDAGLWRLKDGDKAYAAELHVYTTTDYTADQIHQIGLQQVTRLEAEMDRLLRQRGRTEGTVKDRIEKLKADLAYSNWASDESRAQIMSGPLCMYSRTRCCAPTNR